MMSLRIPLLLLLGASPAALVLSGCGRALEPFTIEETRPVEDPDGLRIASTSTERFRYTGMVPPSPGEAGPSLSWELPEGWKENPASGMRLADLRFGENDEGECTVIRLSGSAGGIAANVNRWRGQMGLPEASEEDISSLPTRELFGVPAVYLSLDGDYTGMGSEAKKDYRMLGLILSSEGGAVFVKLTGPRDLVEANTEKFDQFRESLTLKQP